MSGFSNDLGSAMTCKSPHVTIICHFITVGVGGQQQRYVPPMTMSDLFNIRKQVLHALSAHIGLPTLSNSSLFMEPTTLTPSTSSFISSASRSSCGTFCEYNSELHGMSSILNIGLFKYWHIICRSRPLFLKSITILMTISNLKLPTEPCKGYCGSRTTICLNHLQP